MGDRRILMGVVGRPHGVRGLVRVHSYTADPADLAGYGPLVDDAGRAWTLAWRASGVAELRGADGQPLDGRAAAERLVNTKLWIDRDRLPPPDDGEFYLADLVGMAALDPAGAAIGRVSVVHDYGAGTSLEIERPGAACAPNPLHPRLRSACRSRGWHAGGGGAGRGDRRGHGGGGGRMTGLTMLLPLPPGEGRGEGAGKDRSFQRGNHAVMGRGSRHKTPSPQPPPRGRGRL